MKPLLTVGKPEANHQRHAEEFEVTAVEHVLEGMYACIMNPILGPCPQG